MQAITRRAAIGSMAAISGVSLCAAARKPIIRTLLKDMQPEELAGGATLFHEHLSFSKEFATRLSTTTFPGATGTGRGPAGPKSDEKYFLEDLEVMTSELVGAKKDGVACLVDGGHPDMGRSLKFLQQLSMRSGMPIVGSTGYYGQPFYTPEVLAMTDDQLAHELTRQAAATPVGAFGEIGTWFEMMTPDERKVFRAVGKAHKATNLPIFTHTAFGRGALDQLDVLESVGVEAQRVVIGHLGGLIDPKVEVHKQICKRGAFVGFDRQGGNGDTNQIPMVMALVEAGYTNNLMFASDFSVAARLKHNGGPGYSQVVTVFGPKLRAAGMKEETLHQILADNPRRFLSFVPKQGRGKVA